MDAEGGREGRTPSAQGRPDSRYCGSFNKKHLLSTCCQRARNDWTPGPVLFVTPAAPLRSLKSRLRSNLEEQESSPPGDCPSEESTGEEERPSAAGAPPSCGPETLRRHRTDLGSSAHSWGGMRPGQLCPFYIFNK